MFLTSFTSLSALLFFLYWSPSSSLCMVFDTISSDSNDVSCINPSALSLETLMSIIVLVLVLVSSIMFFLSQMALLRWLNFLLWLCLSKSSVGFISLNTTLHWELLIMWLMTQVSHYPFWLLKLIWNCIILL